MASVMLAPRSSSPPTYMLAQVSFVAGTQQTFPSLLPPRGLLPFAVLSPLENRFFPEMTKKIKKPPTSFKAHQGTGK